MIPEALRQKFASGGFPRFTLTRESPLSHPRKLLVFQGLTLVVLTLILIPVLSGGLSIIILSAPLALRDRCVLAITTSSLGSMGRPNPDDIRNQCSIRRQLLVERPSIDKPRPGDNSRAWMLAVARAASSDSFSDRVCFYYFYRVE